MASFLGGWVVAAAVYVLFTGQFSPDELAAAALCGLASSLWATSLRRTVGSPFQFERGAWGAAWRAAAGVPAATGKVALSLTKSIAAQDDGHVERQAFIHGKKQDQRDAARRAVGLLAASLAPDRFVIRAPEEEDRLDLHVLVKTKSGDPRWVI